MVRTDAKRVVVQRSLQVGVEVSSGWTLIFQFGAEKRFGLPPRAAMLGIRRMIGTNYIFALRPFAVSGQSDWIQATEKVSCWS